MQSQPDKPPRPPRPPHPGDDPQPIGVNPATLASEFDAWLTTKLEGQRTYRQQAIDLKSYDVARQHDSFIEMLERSQTVFRSLVEKHGKGTPTV